MIKQITCRAGNTEWTLVRLEQHDFKIVSRMRMVGHPAYYRLVPVDNTGDYEISGGYEVWPSPLPGVDVLVEREEPSTA